MNLENWVKYSGYLPTIFSINMILCFSIVFGILASSVFDSNLIGVITGLGFGISGFLLVILPNIIMINRLVNDEQPFQTEVSS